MAKISGPLLDRIDLHIEAPAVLYRELTGQPTGESSAAIRERVNNVVTGSHSYTLCDWSGRCRMSDIGWRIIPVRG